MKKLVKTKFWSLLIVGIILLILGTYFFVTKKASESTTNLLLIAGVTQLTLFYGVMFYLYKGKMKNALED
jgi:uncharacterized membrane protein HdeD (DUF308 family)